MLYILPDYYKEFHCIAERCEDTCCAGWQIVIDKKSLAEYRKIRGSFLPRMLWAVNWRTSTFRQDKDKRCAFLNDRNLCDLYICQGKKSLCRTCRQYPRHIEEFEGVREITLSVSCPEVARILMEKRTPVQFLHYEREGEETFEDFDPFLFSILEDARKEMIQILQNRKLFIRERVLLILGMAHDMQVRIKRQEMFDCAAVIEKYTGENAQSFVKAFLEKEENRRQEQQLAERMFRTLSALERLRESWAVLLQETTELLYANERTPYGKIRQAFAEWENRNPEVAICLEQLLVYFLFTYFPGAVYDGEVYAKAQMAVYCVWMIRELWMARWLKNERSLDLEEMTELVYRFSREVEHSDENLKQVEKFMEKHWLRM